MRWSGAYRFQVGCEAASVEKLKRFAGHPRPLVLKVLGRQLNQYRKMPTNADGDPAEKNEECKLGSFDQLIAEL